MIDILKMTLIALERKELINLLRGDMGYMIEPSQYSSGAELTDVGKVLSRGIYKVYNEKSDIKIEYEHSLMMMLDMTDFDVYMVCLYIMSQLFKEKNNLSPFIVSKNNIIEKLGEEISKRKNNILNGIVYPSGYKNEKAWNEIKRFKFICKDEYNITLF